MDSKENYSILIVDDDPTVVRILRSILNVFTPLRFATSGKDALLLARKSHPDLILLDIEMPGFSGFDVCKAFKADKALAKIPIIFISSHENIELQTTGLNLGAVDFITKPPHAALVLARVRQQMGIKKLSDTLRDVVSMDFLTGTANRLSFEKALQHEWQRALRSAMPLCVLLMQIDGFSDYQTRVGEETAEGLLRELAEALRSVVHRPTDLLARYATETFAALLPDTDTPGATTVAQRALRVMDALTAWPAKEDLTLYIGIASSQTLISAGSGVTSRDTESNHLLVAGAEKSIRAARAAKKRIVIDGATINTADSESIS